jgi:predicted MFS family arabinose efflux permease
MSETAPAPPAAVPAPAAPAPAKLTRYQTFVVAVLAFLQFTIVLDFMILSPLGALLMRDLHVPAARFGLVMSIYAFSAGISGLASAAFADRFDRKRLLLFFYAGFVLGTLLCGIAPSYHFLLMARMVTGLFGGVIGSISFAIIADLFPLAVRGRVMGVVQTAFAASQVMGIPLGLRLSNHWGWHAPFLMIVAVSAAVGVVIAFGLRPLRDHLALQRPGGGGVAGVLQAVSRRDYLMAFATTTLLVTGGFMLMPFASAFTVNNMGIPITKLEEIYFVTGLCSIVLGPLVGRLADGWGKFRVFCVGTAISMALVVVFTHLGVTPLRVVILVNVVLMAGISARMISASALTSAVPEPQSRGAFMSVNAAIQQFSGGVASAAAGLIVAQDAAGRILHYELLGYVVVAAMAGAVLLLARVNRNVNARAAQAQLGVPVTAPGAAS